MATAENVSKTRLGDLVPSLQTVPIRMGLDRPVVASGRFIVLAYRSLSRRGSIRCVIKWTASPSSYLRYLAVAMLP